MPGLQERFSLFVFSRTQVVELPGSGPFEYVVVGFVPVDRRKTSGRRETRGAN